MKWRRARGRLLLRVWTAACALALALALLQQLALGGDRWDVSLDFLDFFSDTDPPDATHDTRTFSQWYAEERAPVLLRQRLLRRTGPTGSPGADISAGPGDRIGSASLEAEGRSNAALDGMGEGADDENEWEPPPPTPPLALATALLLDTPHLYAPLALHLLAIFRVAAAARHGANSADPATRSSRRRIVAKLALSPAVVAGLSFILLCVSSDWCMALLTYIAVAHGGAQCAAIIALAHREAAECDALDVSRSGKWPPPPRHTSTAAPRRALTAISWATLAAPALLWMCDAARGLDWFPHPTPHLVRLPAPLAPLLWVLWAIAFAAALGAAITLRPGGCQHPAADADADAGMAERRELWVAAVAVVLQAAAWGGMQVEDPTTATLLLTLPHAVPALVAAAFDACDGMAQVLSPARRHWALPLLLTLGYLSLVAWAVVEYALSCDSGTPTTLSLFGLYVCPQLLHVMVDPLARSAR